MARSAGGFARPAWRVRGASHALARIARQSSGAALQCGVHADGGAAIVASEFYGDTGFRLSNDTDVARDVEFAVYLSAHDVERQTPFDVVWAEGG